MSADLFKRAKARIDDAKEIAREQHQRFRDDLRFSNPAKPEQWRQEDIDARGSRAMLTLDRTNQFIQQVSNDIRKNDAGVEVLGVDEDSDPKVAECLEGMIRHIEYRSRAAVAYDMGADLQVRCGLGWLRVVPEENELGDQEARILRVTDPTSCGLDPDCQEPDGYGAKWGYAECSYHERTFKTMWPKAAPVTMAEAGSGWAADGQITVAEYFEVVNGQGPVAADPDDDEPDEPDPEIDAQGDDKPPSPKTPTAGAAEEAADGYEPEEGEKRVRWIKMSGAEILEQTWFPSQFIPIVPVVGYELWIDGKRYLCGLTRRLMDAQRLHNAAMTAYWEFVSKQPSAPFLAPAEAINGYEEYWKKLNGGNPAYLPYNALDDDGKPLPPPSRLMPPPMPAAQAQMATFATEEMQASVGMFKANLGEQGNETSGIAIQNRQREGDTATYHFADNHGKSLAQLGRIIVDMIPRIYTTRRAQQIVGLDGDKQFIKIDPSMKRAVKKDRQSGKVIAINPSIGVYDVALRSGPSFTTQRDETAQQLAAMIQAQPQLAPVLGPMWARMKDMPHADKIAKLLLAMAPPQVQQIEGEGDDVPPHVAAQMQGMQQQMQQMQQVMGQAADHIQQLQGQLQSSQLDALGKAAQLRIDQYNAETQRLKVVGAGMDETQVQAIVMKTLQETLGAQPLGNPGDVPVPAAVSANPQPLLPTGNQPVAPPGPPPEPSIEAMPPHPLAHQMPPPSGGGSVSGAPLV